MKTLVWIVSAAVAVGVAPSAAPAQFGPGGPSGPAVRPDGVAPFTHFSASSNFARGLPAASGPVGPYSLGSTRWCIPSGVPASVIAQMEQPYLQVGWGPGYEDSFRYGASRSPAPNPLGRVLSPGEVAIYDLANTGANAAGTSRVLSPGEVSFYDPTARFQNPGGIPVQSSPISGIRNLPQIPPPPPLHFDFKPVIPVTPPLASSAPPAPLSPAWLGWAAGFLAVVFLVALVGGFRKGRRS